MLFIGAHFTFKDTKNLKVKGWEKVYDTNTNQNKAGVAILISGKVSLRARSIRRDKNGHFIMINVWVQQQYIATLNLDIPNN